MDTQFCLYVGHYLFHKYGSERRFKHLKKGAYTNEWPHHWEQPAWVLPLLPRGKCPTRTRYTGATLSSLRRRHSSHTGTWRPRHMRTRGCDPEPARARCTSESDWGPGNHLQEMGNFIFYIKKKKWVIGVLIIHNFRTQRFTLYSLYETQHRSTVRRVVQRKYPMSYIGEVSRGPRRQEHLVLAGQIGHGHERTRGV